jgi:quercetin dioxygenase-like cupin family protein
VKIHKSKKWKGGWFIGDFKPTAHSTKQFEVCYKTHAKGERWPTHYHKVATEINYMISGKMKIQGKTLAAGDVFILKPGEVADPVFLTDCRLIVAKVPSVKNDKYEVRSI